MATFDLLDAKQNTQVFIRRLTPGGGQVYDPLPYKVVQYDDGTKGIEGICDSHMSDLTFADVTNLGGHVGFVILDRPPYSGVNEID